jgi:hypothetical protein
MTERAFRTGGISRPAELRGPVFPAQDHFQSSKKKLMGKEAERRPDESETFQNSGRGLAGIVHVPGFGGSIA